MRRKTIFVTVIRNILRMKRLGCILCMPHKWTRDSKYSRRRTKIKIFAPPVQIPIAWFSLITKSFHSLSSLPVNSTPHEIVFFYPTWLDNSIVLKYIYYNNINFRDEMLTNLVYAHCFSDWKQRIEKSLVIPMAKKHVWTLTEGCEINRFFYNFGDGWTRESRNGY